MLTLVLGLAIFSALITFFFIRPLSADGMTKEDAEVRCLPVARLLSPCLMRVLQFRQYLEDNGWDTSQMGLLDDTASGGSIPEKDMNVEPMNEKERV